MHSGSSLGLLGSARSTRHRFAWFPIFLGGLWAFHVLFKQNGESGTLFASIGKTADKWSSEILEVRPWSTVTSKLKDWPWENSHAGQKSEEQHSMDEYYTHEGQYDTPKIKIPAKEQTIPHVESHTLTSFKLAWLENEIGGPLTTATLAPISRLCDEVSWNDDIVLNMKPAGGGLGNLRVLILDFIYYALQTGSHIILPTYIKRATDTLYWADESNGAHQFSHLFDTEFLISTLSKACPQMQVFRSIEEAGNNATVSQQFDIEPARQDKTQSLHLPNLTARLRDWVATAPEGYQAGVVNMVTVGVPLFTHDMHAKPRMRMALGRLMKFNNQIRELAATALFNLGRSRTLETAIDPSKQIYHEAYYGMHLRTEVDVGGAWGGYEAQTAFHLDMCQRLNLSLIYLATGNREDVARFANDAQQVGISVISKQDLLASTEEQSVFETSAFDSLSWDQQGVIDYEILSRSSFFSGPAGSTFTWNLALRRAFLIEDDALDRVYAYGIPELEPTVVYDDGISRIVLRGGATKEGVDTVEFFAPEGMYP